MFYYSVAKIMKIYKFFSFLYDKLLKSDVKIQKKIVASHDFLNSTWFWTVWKSGLEWSLFYFWGGCALRCSDVVEERCRFAIPVADTAICGGKFHIDVSFLGFNIIVVASWWGCRRGGGDSPLPRFRWSLFSRAKRLGGLCSRRLCDSCQSWRCCEDSVWCRRERP